MRVSDAYSQVGYGSFEIGFGSRPAILVVDLQDLITATQAPLPPPSASDVAAANASIAAKVPAFVIQAARHLLTEADETTPRRLRFSLGPLQEVEAGADVSAEVPKPTSNQKATFAATPLGQLEQWKPEQWRREMQAIRAASSLPIVILHAPVTPQIVGGRVVADSDADNASLLMQSAAESAGIQVASAQARLLQSAREGRWPHGFDNGYIGSGHLNKVGNAVVGAVLVQQVLDQMAENIGVEIEEGN